MNEPVYDGIIVLTSGMDPRREKLSGWRPDLNGHVRLAAGAALYHDGLAPTVIVTGGRFFGSDRAPLAEVYADILEQKYGLPATAVRAENRAIDTTENLEFSFGLAREHGLHQLLLTTNRFHLDRALMSAARYEERFGIESLEGVASEDVLESLSSRHERFLDRYEALPSGGGRAELVKYVLTVLPYGDKVSRMLVRRNLPA